MSLLKYIALSSALTFPLAALAGEGSATLTLPGGSAALDLGAMEELDGLALWLAADPEREVIVTDSTVMAQSTPEERALALDRANAIQHYLTAQGVSVDQISIRAYDTAVATISGEQQRMITIESGPAVVTTPEVAVAPAPEPVQPVEPAPEEVQPVVGKEPAYTTEPVEEEEEEVDEEGLGFVMSAGAGVNHFFTDAARDLTDPGATWDVRASFATNQYVGVEAAYIGSWNGGEGAVGDDTDIYGNGLEGDLILNPLPDMMVSPYLFGGVGWTNYQVSGDGGDLGVDASDNVLHIPAGVGMAVNVGAAWLDLRGTIRSTFDDELLDPADTAEDSVGLHNWSATARVGFELD